MERLSEKVIKGQIHDGFISQNKFHEVYKPCANVTLLSKSVATIICYAALLIKGC